LQNNAPICLQIPSKVKVTLGKITLFSSRCSEISATFLFFGRNVPDAPLSNEINWCGLIADYYLNQPGNFFARNDALVMAAFENDVVVVDGDIAILIPIGPSVGSPPGL
jgi:hypothetical protein